MITFDSFMLKTLLNEEFSFIESARISKIQQPTRQELILYLRNNGKTRPFYVNINPQFYHLCFMSEDNAANRMLKIPKQPPMFCMLLRKYLNNAKISKVNQPYGERILELYFETYNELNDKIYLCLAIELMGKYSNIILYNTDTNIILGCAHNVGSDKSSVREVYGTIPYSYPPLKNNQNFLNERYGFLLSYPKFNEHNEYFCNNSAIDTYYTYHIAKNKYQTLKTNCINIISKNLKKIENSLSKVEIQINKDVDKYRLWGDLIMANLYNLTDYSDFAEVYDYENNCKIKIKLERELTLKENANKFYKKYNKSKAANIKSQELYSFYLKQKEYYETILYSLKICTNLADLYDINSEINNFEQISGRKEEKKSIQPEFIETKDGNRIYIGKNNRQNDYIVSKLSDDEDWWFHVKNCAGSHILLKSENLTDELLIKCANLAKQNSSAANSSKVGVIYTKRKYLRKPPKANLGYVTYKNEKEIIID